MWAMSEMWELVEFPLSVSLSVSVSVSLSVSLSLSVSVAEIKSLYNFVVRHKWSEVRPDTLPIGSSWQVGRSSYLGGQGGGCI